MDTQGVEDPKLFVWPGKGVYAVFGRKPEALGASPYCRDPIFVQFLVQVRPQRLEVLSSSSSSSSVALRERLLHSRTRLRSVYASLHQQLGSAVVVASRAAHRACCSACAPVCAGCC